MRRSIPLALAVMLSGIMLSSLPAEAAETATQATTAAGPCDAAKRPQFRGRNLTSGPLPASLRCADLTKAKLDGVDLHQKDLTGAILVDASLKEADLGQVHLEYADLRRADLTEAGLTQAQFDHADLRNATLTDAEAGQAEFPYADLAGAKLIRTVLTQATLVNADLTGADLTNAVLGQLKGRNSDFSRAKMHEAKLGQAQLLHATFTGADAREVEFTQADLDGADFTGANVDQASFIQADDVDLTGARGTPVNLPDDAKGPTGGDAPEADEPTGSASDGPVATTERNRSLSLGLVLVILSAAGLVATLALWAASSARRSRAAAKFAIVRRAAEEDVTRLGEEIDQLDFEFQISGDHGMSADGDWRHALDAYEAAKNALTLARTSPELVFVARAVQDGRGALGRLRVRSAR